MGRNGGGVGCQSEDAEAKGSQPVSPCCTCSNDCFFEIPQPHYNSKVVTVKGEQSLSSFRCLRCRQCAALGWETAVVLQMRAADAGGAWGCSQASCSSSRGSV